MRLLVLSDIHANSTALEAALAAARGRWEGAVCLGDVVGYGPDPNEVIDRLGSIAPAIIRGNHDKAAAGDPSAEDLNPMALMAAQWTREQLTSANLEFIERLPAGPLRAGELTLVHGSYQDEDDYVFSPAQALGGLVGSPTNVTFFGHTHIQGGFSYRDDDLQVIQMRVPAGTSFAALRVEAGTRYLLNPGSVGQPRDGDPRAGFAIADRDHGVIEFWRVPYNIAAVQERMREAGLPEPLISRLSFGR
ncbi:MAG: metallophosphoesterase family protein [Candidatus Acidiferrales bacterium]